MFKTKRLHELEKKLILLTIKILKLWTKKLQELYHT